MVDPNESEKTAAKHGGRMGGEYLESIGVFDLSALTEEQYDAFILCVVGGFCQHMVDQEVQANPKSAA